MKVCQDKQRIVKAVRLFGVILGMACAFMTGRQAIARNLPGGPKVRFGQLEITVQDKTMRIDQSSMQAIVNWESFDIGRGYAVEILQPSSSASMLARVTGATASEINGKLTANGSVYLVNPNGILFGEGAVVDVNRLLATTRQLTDQNFLEGRLEFTDESTMNAVANHGILQADAVALVAREVANHGKICAPQAVLAGTAGTVRVENFANGGWLAIDFSDLATEQESRVVNRGTIDAPGGQAILSAGGGLGTLLANEGTVVTRMAEYSGQNAALSRVGNLQAEQVLIDPTADLVIGNPAAQLAGLGYELTAGGVGEIELELPIDAAQPEFTEGVGYGFYDEDGNGWTYMRREANTMGGVLDSYSYFDPVLTYYSADYLTDKLSEQSIILNYARTGTVNGTITVLDRVRLGGRNELTLVAEGSLRVGNGVKMDLEADLTLQSGHDLSLGDLDTGGKVLAVAGNQMTCGRLDASEIVLAAFQDIELAEGIEARDGVINLKGETVRLGGEFLAQTGITLEAGDVIASSDINFHAGDSIELIGNWRAEHHDVRLAAEKGGIDWGGNLHDAATVCVRAGSDATLEGIQATGKVELSAGNGLCLKNRIAGQEVALVAQNGAVMADGDLDAASGGVHVTAGDEISLNASVKGGCIAVTSTDGAVKVAGRMLAEAGTAEVLAGNDVILGTGAEVIGDVIGIQAGGEVRNQGALRGKTGIVMEAQGELVSVGTLDAPSVWLTGNADIQVSGNADSSVAKMFMESGGNGALLNLEWGDDLQELDVTTRGDQAVVCVTAGNVSDGQLISSGTGGAIELQGENVSLRQVEAHSGDISLVARQGLEIGVVQTAVSGDVQLQAREIVVHGDLAAADDLVVKADGRMILEKQECLAAGGNLELAVGDFGGVGLPLKVSAGKRLYVTGLPGARPCLFFARLEGTSADMAIHARRRSVPGLVFFNGRVWMGRPAQMSKVDRAESELFSRICAALEAEQ